VGDILIVYRFEILSSAAGRDERGFEMLQIVISLGISYVARNDDLMSEGRASGRAEREQDI
jgi:hypothetical protein